MGLMTPGSLPRLDVQHLDDGSGVVAAHGADTREAVALTAHDHAPVRQLVHWPDGEPAAPIKELTLPVGQILPHAGRVIEHAAVQLDILAASDDLQWV